MIIGYPEHSNFATTAPVEDIVERLENGGIRPIYHAYELFVQANQDPKTSSSERLEARQRFEYRLSDFCGFYQHVERLIKEFRAALVILDKHHKWRLGVGAATFPPEEDATEVVTIYSTDAY